MDEQRKAASSLGAVIRVLPPRFGVGRVRGIDLMTSAGRSRPALVVLLVGLVTVTAGFSCERDVGPGETRTGGTGSRQAGPREAHRPVADISGHAAVRFVLRYEPASGGDAKPPELALLLTLLPDGTGLLAIENRERPGDGAVVGVAWRRSGGQVELDPGEIGTDFEGLFQWEQWRLALDDEDGDGVLESGRGTARGTYESMRGDVADFAHFEAALTASADTAGPLAAVRAPSVPGRALPVFDRVEVVFSEPVPWAQVASGMRLLAGGRPVQATPAPLGELLGFVTRAVVPLGDFALFGAAFGLDPGGITDPAGNAVRWDESSLQTPADPGPLTANPGFETGLQGWLAEGRVEVHGAWEGLAPAEGAAQATVHSGGRLTGYLDVPGDAQRLEMAVAAFSEVGEFDAGRSALVELHAPGAIIVVFDASGHAAEAAGCEACQEYGSRVGPLRIEADLTPFRGRRVFLTVAASGSSYIGMNNYAVVVDDVHVR